MTAGRALPEAVVARRRAERRALLDLADTFAQQLNAALGVLGVAVFGSVARGDFNAHSDIDVLVVAERLPDDYGARLEALGWPPPARVEPVAWTPAELVRAHRKRNPIAVEAVDAGVWLVGRAPAQLLRSGQTPSPPASKPTPQRRSKSRDE